MGEQPDRFTKVTVNAQVAGWVESWPWADSRNSSAPQFLPINSEFIAAPLRDGTVLGMTLG